MATTWIRDHRGVVVDADLARREIRAGLGDCDEEMLTANARGVLHPRQQAQLERDVRRVRSFFMGLFLFFPAALGWIVAIAVCWENAEDRPELLAGAGVTAVALAVLARAWPRAPVRPVPVTRSWGRLEARGPYIPGQSMYVNEARTTLGHRWIGQPLIIYQLPAREGLIVSGDLDTAHLPAVPDPGADPGADLSAEVGAAPGAGAPVTTGAPGRGAPGPGEVWEVTGEGHMFGDAVVFAVPASALVCCLWAARASSPAVVVFALFAVLAAVAALLSLVTAWAFFSAFAYAQTCYRLAPDEDGAAVLTISVYDEVKEVLPLSELAVISLGFSSGGLMRTMVLHTRDGRRIEVSNEIGRQLVHRLLSLDLGVTVLRYQVSSGGGDSAGGGGGAGDGGGGDGS